MQFRVHGAGHADQYRRRALARAMVQSLRGEQPYHGPRKRAARARIAGFGCDFAISSSSGHAAAPSSVTKRASSASTEGVVVNATMVVCTCLLYTSDAADE